MRVRAALGLLTICDQWAKMALTSTVGWEYDFPRSPLSACLAPLPACRCVSSTSRRACPPNRGVSVSFVLREPLCGLRSARALSFTARIDGAKCGYVATRTSKRRESMKLVDPWSTDEALPRRSKWPGDPMAFSMEVLRAVLFLLVSAALIAAAGGF